MPYPHIFGSLSGSAPTLFLDDNFNAATIAADLASIIDRTKGSALAGYLGVGTGATGRTVEAKLDDFVSVKDFGAKGDGVTNDQVAFTNADSNAKGTFVPNGNYFISSNLTFNNEVVIGTGANFTIATGVTVTFNGGLKAPVSKIFVIQGTATVVFLAATAPIGRPEWWGALPNNSAIDCSVGINASIIACPVTELQIGNYYTTNTVNVTTNHRVLRGQNTYPYDATINNSQIFVNSATITGMQVGSTVSNAGPTTSTLDITVRDLSVTRAVAPTTTFASLTPFGIKVSWCLFPTLYNVVSWDHGTDFWFSGNIQLKVFRTYAARATAATVAANDFWYGYYFDGTSGLNAAGGNASSYIIEALGQNGVTALISGSGNNGSVGIFMNTAGADTYFRNCELNACTTGFSYLGSSGGTKNQSGDADVLIDQCVFDSFYDIGMKFSSAATYSAIKISDCYMAPTSSRTVNPTGCMDFINCGTSTGGGNISVTGCQGIGWPATTTPYILNACFGIQFKGNMWNAMKQAANITNSQFCSFEDNHNNPVEVSTQGGLQFTTSSRCFVKPIINGGANTFGAGVVFILTGNSFIEVNATTINPTATTSGKILNNGVAVTVAGTFNTNCLASGIMN